MNIGDKVKVIKSRYEVIDVGTITEICKIETYEGKIIYGAAINGILYYFYEDEIEKIGD